MDKARFIQFDNGIVCAAHNEIEGWQDVRVQLKERVINLGVGAKMLDAHYNVLASMSLSEAMGREFQ